MIKTENDLAATTPDVKQCKKCGAIKSVSEFYKDKGKKDGLWGSCIACKKANDFANKERNAATSKAYRQRKKKRSGPKKSHTPVITLNIVINVNFTKNQKPTNKTK